MRSMPISTSAAACLSPTTAASRPRNFRAPLRKILRAVIKHLRPIVRRRLRPRRSLPRRLHRIPNILAIPQRSLAQQPPIRRAHFHAVTRIRPRLLPADIKLHRAINRRRCRNHSIAKCVVRTGTSCLRVFLRPEPGN